MPLKSVNVFVEVGSMDVPLTETGDVLIGFRSEPFMRAGAPVPVKVRRIRPVVFAVKLAGSTSPFVTL
jgi:hypothetical protein